MVPKARSPEPFSWKACQASLDRARSAIEGKNPNAASELRGALAYASRMAEYCYDQIKEIKPKEALPPGAFDDWDKFLSDLSKDAWKVYPKYILLRSGTSDDEADLQGAFETICEAAHDALFDLKDLQETYEGKPSQRRPAVEKLRQLVTVLDAALDELGPESKLGDVLQVEEIHKPNETQEAGEVNEAHQTNDADSASDAAETLTDIAPAETVPVLLLGRIAAGGPNLAEQSIEDIFPLPKQLVGEGTLFLLRVKGNSMRDAAIKDGDWLVIRQQPEAENNEIVAALIDGEATVKTFKQSGGHTWLVPHNPAYKPILADEATILGKVVAVLRRV